MPQQHPRTVRPTTEKIASYLVWLNSWDLAEKAAGRKEKTRVGRMEDLKFFAFWLALHRPKLRAWEQVDIRAVREFFAWLQSEGTPCPHVVTDGAQAAPECHGYAKGYVRHVAMSTALFFEWLAAEEDIPNVLDRVQLPSGPALGKTAPPVHEDDEIRALISDAEKGRDFTSRRDAALLRLLACAGPRLSEVAGMTLADLRVDRREVTVTGKGDRTRTLRFDDRAAIALDRYLRVRARREGAPMAPKSPLWLGHIRGGMTASGIRQAITKRAKKIGIHTFPHKWRHTFSHRWLDNGGSEGDLMELNGWDSPQMLRHYGASARGARARRHYDNVDVMGGI